MTDQEHQRQMDFTLAQQAQFTARIQKLQETQVQIQQLGGHSRRSLFYRDGEIRHCLRLGCRRRLPPAG